MSNSFGFYSIVSSLKEKSNEALSTLSNDLGEFSATIRTDVGDVSRNVVHKVDSVMEEKKKRKEQDCSTTGEKQPSISSSIFAFGNAVESFGAQLLHGAEEFLATNMEEEVPETADNQSTKPSGQTYRLLALQEDTETYINAPMDASTFENWRNNLSDNDRNSLKDEIMKHYPAVRLKLSELVPVSVDEADFWDHYLYKASLLAAQESCRAKILEQADDSEEELGWDFDLDDHDLMQKAEESSMVNEKPVTADNDSKVKNAHATASSSHGDYEGKSEAYPNLGELNLKGADGKIPGTSSAPVSQSSCSDESWVEIDEVKKRSEIMKESASLIEETTELSSSNAKEQKILRTNDDDDVDVDDWGEDDIQLNDSTIDNPIESCSEENRMKDAARLTRNEIDDNEDDWGAWD